MSKSELPGGKFEDQSARRVESLAERITKIEDQIRAAVAEGNFNLAHTLSVAREKIKDESARKNREQALAEALPDELRRSIEGARERIAAIEDGSFEIYNPALKDPSLKATILANLREHIAAAEEDLLIIDGVRPSYEEQIKELEREIADLIERYARRWEELVQSGDETRILAFLGDLHRNLFEKGGHKSPYETALWNVKVYLAMQTAHDFAEPRASRDRLLGIKNKLEDTLRRTDTTSN